MSTKIKSAIENLITELEQKHIRYMVIGGQAVILYGAPQHTFDSDLWIDPASRESFFKIADKLDLDYDDTSKNKPLYFCYAEDDKIDVFIVKKISMQGKGMVVFDDCYNRSVVLKDPSGFTVRVPSVDDLISLKNCKPGLSAKDKEDIEYLKVKKAEDLKKEQPHGHNQHIDQDIEHRGRHR